ncbi:MAG: TIR domain-containing protein, partial [Candidatus Hodarchaeota archaeon]
RLTAIPTFLWSLKNLSTLDFGGNPLRAEDESIAQKPPEFILDYLRKKATIRVFISHAMKDYEKYRIKELAQYLEQQEEISEVYICEEHLVGNIDEWMLEMVPQSELLLFIATQKSVFDSPDCRNEIDLANKFSIPAVPLKTVEVDWIDLIELRMARELGKEFKVEHFDTLCQDLYQYIYELKRNINLMERDRRVTDLSTIYEQFQITYKNLERKFEHKIRSLEERVKLLEKRFN